MRDSSSQELKILGGTGSGNEEGEADGQRGETREGKEERRFYKRRGASKIDGRRSDTEVSAEHTSRAETGVHICTHQEPGQQQQRIRPHTRQPHSIRATHQTHIYMQAQPHTRNIAETRKRRAQRLYTYVTGCAIRRHDSP